MSKENLQLSVYYIDVRQSNMKKTKVNSKNILCQCQGNILQNCGFEVESDLYHTFITI